ncbi:FUSC family protein [Cryobacterium tagatosivorans]|uniref:FUSC family protein n=1 Tax=Cryobacterium tagatosivorans TaxID=1259199 RepID=A0A4R8UIJ9_9MICO|nr:FUSC family protein [Cryobacterium tagatosivorans]TFB53252.1 FUSC family protein [Cryobacterium tagatosivorans]
MSVSRKASDRAEDGRLRRAAARLKSGVRHPELLLAAKAALAVGISWSIAPYLPGVANDYPYYAPLGALVSMAPTLMGSVKNGLQTVAGLAIGVLLAGVVIVFSEPNVFTISLVVGIGFLISGNHRITTAREFVPVTALFVLIVGGPNADSYSIGYLVQVCLGISVGLAVNLLILPPLRQNAAAAELSRFRTTLARHLRDISEALTESWPPEHEAWATRGDTLSRTAGEVRAAVVHADESRRGNPRALIHRRDLPADYDDVAALETVSFHVRNLTDVLAGAVWGKPLPVEVPGELRPPLGAAIRSVARILDEWDSGTGVLAPPRDEAEAELRSLRAELDRQRHSGAEAISAAAAVEMDLRRILVALRPSVERDAEDIPTPAP